MPPDVLAQPFATTPPSSPLAHALLDVASPLLAQVAAGPYLSWWKLLIVTLVFMAWARVLLWIDKDSDNARMPREAINSGMWAVLVIALVAMVFVPVFPLALLIFAGLGLASIFGYLMWRKSVVGLEDIPEQLAGFFKGMVTFGKKGGIKKQDKEKDVGAGLVTLLDSKGRTPPAPEDDAPERVGYDTAHRALADPLYKGAERIALVQIAGKPGTGEESGDRFATKYAVDGFDYPGSAFAADAGMAASQYLKELAGLDPAERRKVQKGAMRARTAGAAYELAVVASGSRGGESLVFEVDVKGPLQDPRDRPGHDGPAEGDRRRQRRGAPGHRPAGRARRRGARRAHVRHDPRARRLHRAPDHPRARREQARPRGRDPATARRGRRRRRGAQAALVADRPAARRAPGRPREQPRGCRRS